MNEYLLDTDIKKAQLEKIKAETRKINAETAVISQKNDEIIINYIKEDIDGVIDKLPYNIKDTIYRKLWASHVREDFEIKIKEKFNNHVDITDEDIDRMVYLYVYEGLYDCNLPYWDNIDNLIVQVLREKTSEI